MPKNCDESTELSVFPGMIFRSPCRIMCLQEAAGLTLDPYVEEARRGKTRGIVVHSRTGAPALAVLARGDETTYFEPNKRFQSSVKRSRQCPRINQLAGFPTLFLSGSISGSWTRSKYWITATTRLPDRGCQPRKLMQLLNQWSTLTAATIRSKDSYRQRCHCGPPQCMLTTLIQIGIRQVNPSSILELDETFFENYETENRPPFQISGPSKSGLTRMDVNEVTVCNFRISSKMLRKDNGSYDLVRADFTSSSG